MKKQRMLINRSRKAFSMVELMAVIVIIGLIGTVVTMKVLTNVEKTRVATTIANIKTLKNAITQYNLDTNGLYPPDLEALVEAPEEMEGYPKGGYLESKKVPLDGWKQEFMYELDPEPDVPFLIFSYGADQDEGGEGFDSDLFSTDLR